MDDRWSLHSIIVYLLGDQYFDKAMNGFMKELFGKIKVVITGVLYVVSVLVLGTTIM